MFKSKHSGWTWELRRTPFGGGGGGGILDSVSSALGTDGSGGGALGALASIDPGPAIGNGLAQVDQAVNNNIPGGWITVGGLAAGGLALAYAPEVMALASSQGITPEAAALATGTMPVDVTTGATVSPDVFAGYSATGSDAGFAGSQLTADQTLALNAAPYAGDSQYAAQDVMQQARDTSVPSGSPTSWDNGLSSTMSVSNAANLAKSLMSGGNSNLSSAAQNLAKGQTGVASAIPGIIRGNQNPFVQSQNFAVSTPKPDLSALINLLKQG